VSDVLGAMDLPAHDAAPRPEREEDRVIREVLRSTGGNRTAAAKLLGMSRVTLWKRLKAMRSDPGAAE